MPEGQKRTQDSGWRVFISHAGADTWVAGRIAERVDRCGATSFLDEANIAAGEDFEERILAALGESQELLVLFTPWSLKRTYVWAEIGAAWMKRMPIVGVLYGVTPEQLQAESGIPVLIKKRNLIEINRIDKYFAELSQRTLEARRNRRGKP